MGYSPWGLEESDTIGATEHIHTYPPTTMWDRNPQKSPSCPFQPTPSPPREAAVGPLSHRHALPALQRHTN